MINVTDIKQQKNVLEELFQQRVVKERIDNTFFSKKDYKNVNMCSLYKHLRENRRYFVNYNIELFAEMYLHPKDRLYPTMLIFRTGSYIL